MVLRVTIAAIETWLPKTNQTVQAGCVIKLRSNIYMAA